MMPQVMRLAGVLGFLLSAHVGWSQTGGASGMITGATAYRQRVALPPEASVDIRLEDVSQRTTRSS